MRVGPSVPRHFTLFISSVISILPRQISTNGPVFSTSVGGCRRQQVSVFCCANAAPFLRPSIDDGGGGATSQGKSKRDGLHRNKRRVFPRFDVRKQNFDAAHCYQTHTSLLLQRLAPHLPAHGRFPTVFVFATTRLDWFLNEESASKGNTKTCVCFLALAEEKNPLRLLPPLSS